MSSQDRQVGCGSTHRTNEIKRLFKRVEEMLAADPSYRQQIERTGRIQALRQRLIELRENTLKSEFADTPFGEWVT